MFTIRLTSGTNRLKICNTFTFPLVCSRPSASRGWDCKFNLCKHQGALGRSKAPSRLYALCLMAGFLLLIVGCGTTREQHATNQLLLSDAIDRSVSHLDFSPLSGEKIYFDTTYIPATTETSKFSSQYVISSIRQQMLISGCLIQDKKDDADLIVEARVGAIGQDAHDVNYGIPGNSSLTTAASLVSSSPPLPSFPEVSLARRTEDSAVAKIAVFAYHRDSKRPIWQSGLSLARSSSRNKWILGAGPFQSGEIHGETRFAGRKLNTPFKKQYASAHESEQAYRNAAVFDEELQKKLRGEFFAETGDNAKSAVAATGSAIPKQEETAEVHSEESTSKIKLASREMPENKSKKGETSSESGK